MINFARPLKYRARKMANASKLTRQASSPFFGLRPGNIIIESQVNRILLSKLYQSPQPHLNHPIIHASEGQMEIVSVQRNRLAGQGITGPGRVDFTVNMNCYIFRFPIQMADE